MSMMIGITTIKYLDQPEDAAEEYLNYLLENEPDECWIMRDQGHSILEVGMDDLTALSEEWKKEKNKDEEEMAEVREWFEDLKRESGGQNPVMLHISV